MPFRILQHTQEIHRQATQTTQTTQTSQWCVNRMGTLGGAAIPHTTMYTPPHTTYNTHSRITQGRHRFRMGTDSTLGDAVLLDVIPEGPHGVLGRLEVRVHEGGGAA